MIHYYAKIGSHTIELTGEQYASLHMLAHTEPPQLPEHVLLVKHNDGQGFIVPGVAEFLATQTAIMQQVNAAFMLPAHLLAPPPSPGLWQKVLEAFPPDSPQPPATDFKAMPLDDIPPLE